MSNGRSGDAGQKLAMSSETQSDIKEFLAWQQDGISEVTAILKNDLKAFEAMVRGTRK